MSIEQVADRIYKIPSILGPRRFAQWLVVGEDGVLLVDSGIDGTIAEHVVPALGELGLAPEAITRVVISHADVDHYGGNGELRRVAPNATIASHALDRPWIESWGTISAARYGWYRGYGLDYDAGTWGWLHGAAGPDTALDGTVADGDVIDLGGIAVEIIELPGHSLGHVGVLHRGSGTAIVMDAVLERGLYTVDDERISPPPYGTVAGYRGSIARLRELAPQRLGTSHYPPTEGPAAVAAFLDASAGFVDELEACVRATLADDPQPLFPFWERAATTLGPFREMSVELGRSVGAHLEALVEDGTAREVEVAGLPAWVRA